MGLLAEIAAFRSPLEKRSNLSNPAQWLINWANGGPPGTVNERSAMSIPTVFACVNAIASDLATLPIKVYRRDSDVSRSEVHGSMIRYLLNVEPNRDMTAATFRRTIQAHRQLWGFGLAEIEYDNAGRPMGLWPLLPEKVTRRIDAGGRFVFDYAASSGATVTLQEDEVLHFPNLSHDGRVGLSTVQIMRESLGIAKAQQSFAQKFYQNGVKVSGVFKHPKALGDKAYTRLQSELKKHSDPDSAAGTMILEEDMDFQQLSMPLGDAEFVDTLGFSVLEICRMFRVPPHKVMDLSRATFSNIESQQIGYVTDTLRPYMVMDEQEINRKLLSGSRSGELYCEYSAEALLRGDVKARYDAYTAALSAGWINRDQVAARENMNPLPDGQGKVYTVNANTYNLQAVKDGTAGVQRLPGAADPKPEPEDDDEPDEPADAARSVSSVIEDAVSRVLRVESDKARRAHKAGKLPAWVAEFYGQDHVDHVRSAIFPALDTIDAIMRSRLGEPKDKEWRSIAANAIALAHVSRSRNDCAGDFEAAVKDWDEQRSARDAGTIIKMLRGYAEAAWGDV